MALDTNTFLIVLAAAVVVVGVVVWIQESFVTAPQVISSARQFNHETAELRQQFE
jgi:Flp pilus assembly protein CpaB